MLDKRPWELEGVTEAEFWKRLTGNLVFKSPEILSYVYEDGTRSYCCHFCEKWESRHYGHTNDCSYMKARLALEEVESDESVAVGRTDHRDCFLAGLG